MSEIKIRNDYYYIDYNVDAQTKEIFDLYYLSGLSIKSIQQRLKIKNKNVIIETLINNKQVKDAYMTANKKAFDSYYKRLKEGGVINGQKYQRTT